MMQFAMLTDSTCDLPQELAQELELGIVPLILTVDGTEYRHYLDYRELSVRDFYTRLNAGAPVQTAQIGPAEFRDVLESPLKEGRDVLYLVFSSGTSGTFQTASLVGRELQADYPGRRVVIYDTLCCSGGEGLFVYLAARYAQSGKTLDEVLAYLDGIRPRLVHWFTVDDLDHLHRGGRISAAAALVGGMLGIKPVLHVDDAGRLIPMEKVRGRRKALARLVDHMAETAENAPEQTVFVCHADCPDDGAYVVRQVKERTGAKDVRLFYIGPLIGCHSGPGTVALFFLGSKR